MTASANTEAALEDTLQRAIAAHQAGLFEQAEELYLTILQGQPYHAVANHNMGLLAGQVGQFAAGLPYLHKALSANPDEGQFWLSYANGLLQAGQAAEALDIIKTAIARGLDNDASQAIQRRSNEALALAAESPSQSEIDHIVALYQAGDYREMEAACRSLLQQFPESPFAWSVLGTALQIQGKDALAVLKRTTELTPHDAQAHGNLGNAWQSAGKFDKALDSYLRALEIDPSFAEAHNNLGSVLRLLDRQEEAKDSFHKAIAMRPDYASAMFNLANVLRELKDYPAAIEQYRAVSILMPDDAEVQNSLGSALRLDKNYEEAIACYRQAVQLKPDYADAHFNLGTTLLAAGRDAEAVSCLQSALEHETDNHEIHFYLGNALRNTYRPEEAMDSFRQALALKSDFNAAEINLCSLLQLHGDIDGAIVSAYRARNHGPAVPVGHTNLLFCLSHSVKIDAAKLFEEHRAFGEQFEQEGRAHWPKHGNDKDPNRCLRVGFVSGDFNEHVVSNFVVPVLSKLAGSPGLSLHGYYNNSRNDSATERLKQYLVHWNDVLDLSDAELSEKIQEDQIDILIDLSGHTAYNRLQTFALKPAPIQASWIGYPGSTGLRAMDYYIADRYFAPPEIVGQYMTEKLALLPACLPFLPSALSPAIRQSPALSNGYITFGSFNRLSKLNRSVIKRWSELLHAQPSSKMVLAAMHKQSDHDTLTSWFEDEGISRDRLSFHQRTHLAHYLELHQQIDVCLDTFPYTGGTTTMHALWMGVPTLTLAGDTIASRAGACILQHVGLDAFVARDDTDFVQKGLFLSKNIVQLAALRATMRDRLENSPIGKADLIAEGFELALRNMWHRWCADQDPQTFEIERLDSESQG
jgi:predicted O-linked N-acetylglucosamine transferase (SPINDLY family)